MCRFSHFDRRNRSATSKYLTFAFVISILVHGIVQSGTAIWLLTRIFSACAFLQKFHVSVFFHLISGLLAVFLSISSLILTLILVYKKYSRYFVFGMAVVVVFEISSGVSAVVLDNLVEDDLSKQMDQSFLETLSSLNSTTINGDTDCWLSIQQKFKCCGYGTSGNWCFLGGNTTVCDLNSRLFQSCQCDKKDHDCRAVSDDVTFRKPCLGVIKDRLHSAYSVIISMDSVFCVMQCLSYIAVHCILLKLNSKNIIDTYKPKTTGR